MIYAKGNYLQIKCYRCKSDKIIKGNVKQVKKILKNEYNWEVKNNLYYCNNCKERT